MHKAWLYLYISGNEKCFSHFPFINTICRSVLNWEGRSGNTRFPPRVVLPPKNNVFFLRFLKKLRFKQVQKNALQGRYPRLSKNPLFWRKTEHFFGPKMGRKWAPFWVPVFPNFTIFFPLFNLGFLKKNFYINFYIKKQQNSKWESVSFRAKEFCSTLTQSGTI